MKELKLGVIQCPGSRVSENIKIAQILTRQRIRVDFCRQITGTGTRTVQKEDCVGHADADAGDSERRGPRHVAGGPALEGPTQHLQGTLHVVDGGKHQRLRIALCFFERVEFEEENKVFWEVR